MPFEKTCILKVYSNGIPNCHLNGEKKWLKKHLDISNFKKAFQIFITWSVKISRIETLTIS